MLNTKINVSLNRDLKKKYGIRRFPVVKGDIVKIVSGSRKGESGKVIGVSHKTKKIAIEGITIAKADGKQVEYYIDHSNLVVTKLDLSIEGRFNKIKEITARRNLPTPEPEKPAESEATPVESEPVDVGESSGETIDLPEDNGDELEEDNSDTEETDDIKEDDDNEN
ncbi:50S ribosomal protein L24 [Ferroplasma acidarmanus]|uniref:50S ribosomal protein L24 n=1 Tax=Ferroplasma acidarmanus Fer1 TaxID=333146 RepID=S0AQA5_FERAC|nr:50S ribosomal protein L24 [Ferroplasma acidarmanus]AGO61126.1 50S ribosomal protein L24P [Ferroplasma acidarmanus Fer1]